MNKEQKNVNLIPIPMIALRGVNCFPRMLMTFDVERRPSVEALNVANRFDRIIFLAAQINPSVDIPEEKDLYKVGVVCKIKQQLSAPNSSYSRVMVEGLYRAIAVEMKISDKSTSAIIAPLVDKKEKTSDVKKEALMRNCIELYEEFLQEDGSYTPEQILGIIDSTDPSYVADHISQNVPFSVEDKQLLLEELRPCKRLELLGRILNRELDIMSIEKELSGAANDAMSKAQREYYLHEELKIIQSELNGGDSSIDDFTDYRDRISKLDAPDEVKEKLLKEVSHLSKQPYGSSEASVIRSYLDTCLEIPWGIRTKETIDLKKARKQLDKDHYGLDKVKDRIIEYLAVKQLSPDIKGGLICLVGPPGTGKTSIAMSIAKAVNRKLVRISLGGVHDEAEIRGHRKTYIGSMPGRIMNGIIQAKSCNPLMVLDEIDKLGSDYRGDPSAALLETLDPEQNSTFRDNFLEIPFDLSETFFITTANTTDTIPRALLDRMEVIELFSYTDEEKVQIAKKHLLPKQRSKHGLDSKQLIVKDSCIRMMISSYTRESGVRILEREIAHLCRVCATGIASGEYTSLTVDKTDLERLIGPVKYKPDEKRNSDTVGLVRGLAWTSVGGEVLDVEVAVVDGSGKLEITGNLGDVMKESAKAAVTAVRAIAPSLSIDQDFYKNKDVHIHFPEGAIPKDGPSAGITMTIAIVSALTGIPVRHDIAMTGEITLRGRVMPIGGLREKTMAALRSGVKTVIIPYENESDLAEIDPIVRSKLKFVTAKTIDDVLPVALTKMPCPEEKWQELTSIKQNSLNPRLRADNSSKARSLR